MKKKWTLKRAVRVNRESQKQSSEQTLCLSVSNIEFSATMLTEHLVQYRCLQLWRIEGEMREDVFSSLVPLFSRHFSWNSLLHRLSVSFSNENASASFSLFCRPKILLWWRSVRKVKKEERVVIIIIISKATSAKKKEDSREEQLFRSLFFL